MTSHAVAPVPVSRRTALAVLCAGALMMIVDETVANVALRSIQRDLGVSQPALAWVLNAYLIAFGACCCSPAASATSSGAGASSSPA